MLKLEVSSLAGVYPRAIVGSPCNCREGSWFGFYPKQTLSPGSGQGDLEKSKGGSKKVRPCRERSYRLCLHERVTAVISQKCHTLLRNVPQGS